MQTFNFTIINKKSGRAVRIIEVDADNIQEAAEIVKENIFPEEEDFFNEN